MVGFPSDSDFDGMVRGHMLRDCTINTDDISHARRIYGPHRDSVRGKTTRAQPRPAQLYYVAVPRSVRRPGTGIDVSADVFFVNRMPFLVTRSRRMRFITTEGLSDRRDPAWPPLSTK